MSVRFLYGGKNVHFYLWNKPSQQIPWGEKQYNHTVWNIFELFNSHVANIMRAQGEHLKSQKRVESTEELVQASHHQPAESACNNLHKAPCNWGRGSMTSAPGAHYQHFYCLWSQASLCISPVPGHTHAELNVDTTHNYRVMQFFVLYLELARPCLCTFLSISNLAFVNKGILHFDIRALQNVWNHKTSYSCWSLNAHP